MSWSKDYKKSIDCDSPKGFSQRAHCAARKKRQKGEKTLSKSPFYEMKDLKPYKTVEQIAKKHRMDVSFIQKQLDMGEPIEHEHTKDHKLAKEIALQHLDEIPDYYTRLKKMEADAKKHHKKFKDVNLDKESVIELEKQLVKLDNISYDSIDRLMRSIMKKYDMTAEQLHNAFVYKHKKTPDDWIKEKLNEGNLHQWFKGSRSKDGKPGWVNVVTGGTCASDEPGEGTPKCVSSAKRASMTPAERRSASRRKKAADPEQQKKSGAAKPTYVSTDVKKEEKKMQEQSFTIDVAGHKSAQRQEKIRNLAKGTTNPNERSAAQKKLSGPSLPLADEYVIEGEDIKGKSSGKKDACYHKVKSRYDVWPSAYASGALVKCRKVGAKNWGTKTEQIEMQRYCPKCKKNETQSECKYGPRYWATFSEPITLTSNQLKYDPNRPHPANEEKDHEYSMVRSEISTIIAAAKRLKKKMRGEGNIEAWVQSKITKAADYLDSAADYVDSGEMSTESVSVEDANGKHYVDFIDIIKPEPLKPSEGIGSNLLGEESKKCWPGYKKTGTQKLFGKTYNRCVKKEQYSDWRSELAEDWQKVNRQDKTDGLSQKAVDAYRRENPGSKLQTAVTEKNPEGKRAKRRANFCRRMKGMKSKLTSAKTARDPDSRINKALRRWRCN
jgi:hypothetical protein